MRARPEKPGVRRPRLGFPEARGARGARRGQRRRRCRGGGVSGGRGAGHRGRQRRRAGAALRLGSAHSSAAAEPSGRPSGQRRSPPRPTAYHARGPGPAAGAARTPCRRAKVATAGRCPRSFRTASRCGRRYKRRVVGTEPGLERGEGDKWRGEPQRGIKEESPGAPPVMTSLGRQRSGWGRGFGVRVGQDRNG